LSNNGKSKIKHQNAFLDEGEVACLPAKAVLRIKKPLFFHCKRQYFSSKGQGMVLK
jgi:hypothetical protein